MPQQQYIPQSAEQQQETSARLNSALRAAFSKKGIQHKAKMAEFLGYKSPYFSGLTTGKEKLTAAFLHALATKLNINTEWVLTGNGSMFMPQSNDNASRASRALVPLVPLYAHAGSLGMFSDGADDAECERIMSPIDGVDMAITISGESMTPAFPNGSIVLIKKINENAFIEWGKPYVLDTCNGIIMKNLMPSEIDGRVRCVSVNPDPLYAPFEVDLTDVYGIYAVKFAMARC